MSAVTVSFCRLEEIFSLDKISPCEKLSAGSTFGTVCIDKMFLFLMTELRALENNSAERSILSPTLA